MSKLSCQEVRALAGELAVGTISGDERAQVLGHIATCLECRRFVETLSEGADALLLLAPEHEPPAGFESQVLSRMRRPSKPRARSVAAFAAAALLAAAAGAGVVFFATAEIRELGIHYRHELQEANGDYFGVKRLVDPSGAKVGNVFLYTGNTDWVFVVIEEDLTTGSFTADAKTKDAGVVEIGRFELGADDRTWGRHLEVDPRSVVALRLHSPTGAVLVADFR